MLELRTVALHRMSEERRRMMKVVDFGDLAGMGVASLTLHAPRLLSRLGDVVAAHYKVWPELVHRAVVANAPPAFAKLWRVLDGLLSPQMRGRLSVLPPSHPVPAIAPGLLTAAALHEWCRLCAAAAERGAAAGGEVHAGEVHAGEVHAGEVHAGE
eukprot:gene30503-23375_t